MTQEQEELKKARQKIKDIIENPLMEYHHSEGHVRPKECVEGDIDAIMEVLNHTLASHTATLLEEIEKLRLIPLKKYGTHTHFAGGASVAIDTIKSLIQENATKH